MEEKASFPAIIVRGEGERVGGGVTEDYKRSSHEDFQTSSELKANQFSGIRHNSITDNMEIWILGNVAGVMSKERMIKDPKAWEELYRDVYGLNSVTSTSR